MKILLLAAFIFYASVAGAQTPEPLKSKAEHEIKKLMLDWMIAVKQRDIKALNRIVGPEFTLDAVNNFEEPALPRAIWISNTMQFLKLDSVSYPKMKIDIIGSTAVVRSTFYWAGSFKEKSFVDSSAILIDTWIKRKEGWQVVSRLAVD
jgi:hypothetical protein